MMCFAKICCTFFWLCSIDVAPGYAVFLFWLQTDRAELCPHQDYCLIFSYVLPSKTSAEEITDILPTLIALVLLEATLSEPLLRTSVLAPQGTLSTSWLRVFIAAALEVTLCMSLLRVLIDCPIPSLGQTCLSQGNER